jgi:hypothetical protein
LGTGLFVGAEVGVVKNDFGIGGLAGSDDKGVAGPGVIPLAGHHVILVDGVFKEDLFLAIAYRDDPDPRILLGENPELMGDGGFGRGLI